MLLPPPDVFTKRTLVLGKKTLRISKSTYLAKLLWGGFKRVMEEHKTASSKFP